jgi:hypothetical protein
VHARGTQALNGYLQRGPLHGEVTHSCACADSTAYLLDLLNPQVDFAKKNDREKIHEDEDVRLMVVVYNCPEQASQ